MTASLPAAGPPGLSVWGYSIDIESDCREFGSLLMRTQIDQAAAAPSWMQLLGRPCRPDLPLISITDRETTQTHTARSLNVKYSWIKGNIKYSFSWWVKILLNVLCRLLQTAALRYLQAHCAFEIYVSFCDQFAIELSCLNISSTVKLHFFSFCHSLLQIYYNTNCSLPPVL